MKNILSKLTKEELKELSESIQEQQKLFFGNPLSLRKQEQFMSNLFGVKNWSTLLGTFKKNDKPFDPKSEYQKTVIQVEILSDGYYTFENLQTIHEDITFGDYSGVYKEVSRESLSKEEMINACLDQGTDPGFFISEEDS